MATDLNTIFRGVLAVIGVSVCVYTLHTETSLIPNPNHKASCSSRHMSCKAALLSKYGRGFGLVEDYLGKDSILNIPNPIIDLAFYYFVLMACFMPDNITVLKVLSVCAAVVAMLNVYLGYLLFLMNDICVVCIISYVVNFHILLLNYKKFCELSKLKVKTE